jgi:hypothetical protein
LEIQGRVFEKGLFPYELYIYCVYLFFFTKERRRMRTRSSSNSRPYTRREKLIFYETRQVGEKLLLTIKEK